MSKQKIMLVAGCSHAAGHEIDGEQDSDYNRNNNFGARLANMAGYEQLNIALGGQSNPSIMRSVLLWFRYNYDPEKHEVFPVIAWTESSRMDVPSPFSLAYKTGNPNVHWYPRANNLFLQINSGWKGGNPEEIKFLPPYHEFQLMNEKYLEIISANCVLQLQYFFQANNLNYVMCNTMHMFEPNAYLGTYLPLIDDTKYIDVLDNDLCFYWYYRNLGYQNPKAKYWHHDETPHQLYAEKLFNFIKF